MDTYGYVAINFVVFIIGILIYMLLPERIENNIRIVLALFATLVVVLLKRMVYV